jgi:ferredoxin-NADP reductase
MARATVLGRLTWRVATVAAVCDETPSARTIVLDVPDWPGHLAGQHVDVRLTAPDGYSTQRSYSIASAPAGNRLELTVDVLPDGEVSPYLARVLSVGDPLEVRGPIGGWFVWDSEKPEPVQLIGGGSGVVPLMAMIRAREAGGAQAPFRLLYSARRPEATFYRDELRRSSENGSGLSVTYAYTREVPQGWERPPGRVDASLLAQITWAPEQEPISFVCGPTGFVETVADLLVSAGHDPARIRTERFGPSGGGS